MAVRTSEAEWKGDLRGGEGMMKLGGGAFQGRYSYSSRFEEGPGTIEELIAAAHAGCFNMAFAAQLSEAGFTPARVQTTAKSPRQGGRCLRDHPDRPLTDRVPNIPDVSGDRRGREAGAPSRRRSPGANHAGRERCSWPPVRRRGFIHSDSGPFQRAGMAFRLRTSSMRWRLGVRRRTALSSCCAHRSFVFARIDPDASTSRAHRRR